MKLNGLLSVTESKVLIQTNVSKIKTQNIFVNFVYFFFQKRQ